MASDPSLSTAYAGVVIAFVGVFGYMLTEFGHYSIYQKPKYATRSERVFFWLTVAGMAGAALWALWWLPHDRMKLPGASRRPPGESWRRSPRGHSATGARSLSAR